MKKRLMITSLASLVFSLTLLFCNFVCADTIDPDNDNSQYAYGENIGWLNFDPVLGPGVTVTDTALIGYVWGENIGWINLSPAQYGGVGNDNGVLTGYAWGENVGWINFQPLYSGVSLLPIDSQRAKFDGWAWGENIGWIHFNSVVPVSIKL